MGFFSWLASLFRGGPRERGPRLTGTRPAAQTATQPLAVPGFDPAGVSARLGMGVVDLMTVPVEYDEFTIPKRRGGLRKIFAPRPEIKTLQKRILRRVLGRLKAHKAAMGFERGRSIVTHARLHAGAAVLVRMDIRDFFPTTRAERVQAYFQAIGWSPEAANLLTKLCTYEGHLPQGAPTSPRLSNLVNYGLDARLTGVARKLGATYSRYADDLMFSFAADDRDAIGVAIRVTKLTCAEYGYILHLKQKLSIRRRHQRQAVTGLVVNDGHIRLPREVRRRLRAVRHRAATGGNPSLTPDQLAGWAALEKMIARQSGQAS